MNDTTDPGFKRRWFQWGALALALGLALQLWLSFRSWIYFDQVLLYQLGLRGLEQGTLYPYAKAVSSGYIPGALLEILIGFPLALWMDYRAPILLLGLLQLLGATVLWRTSAKVSGERFATLFLVVYWLGPWRLYHSGFIWEPTYLLLPAGLHYWASMRSTEKADLLAAATLGFVALAAVQLHPSGIVLGASTAVMALCGLQRLHLGGTVLGAAFGGATLLPTFKAWTEGVLPITAGSSWTDLGLLKIYPLLKDLTYWWRLGSLDVGRRIRQIDVAPSWQWMTTTLALVVGVSVVFSVIANVRWFRRSSMTPSQNFSRKYAGVLLGTHILAMGFSTVTPQGWHLMVLLHAASLPVAWLGAEWLDHDRRSLRWATWSFLSLRLLIIVPLGLAHPMYQQPADDPNRRHVEADRLDLIELVPIPFGGDASRRGPVPWEPATPTNN